MGKAYNERKLKRKYSERFGVFAEQVFSLREALIKELDPYFEEETPEFDIHLYAAMAVNLPKFGFIDPTAEFRRFVYGSLHAERGIRMEATRKQKAGIPNTEEIRATRRKEHEERVKIRIEEKAIRRTLNPPILIKPPKKLKQRRVKVPRSPKGKNDGWWTLYSRYLESPAWAGFRVRILRERGSRCEQCSASNCILHVHHLTYDRVGEELPEDVIVLCIPCHEKAHGRRIG